MLFDEIKEIIAQQLEISEDDIEMTSSLADELGAEALDMVDIGMTLEDQYSVEVSESALESFVTVEDIVSFIEANLD